MAVLPELGDENARLPALGLGERLDFLADALEVLVAGVRTAVDTGDRAHVRAVPAEHLLERIGDLADRGARPSRFDGQLEQVAIARGGLRERVERGSQT